MKKFIIKRLLLSTVILFLVSMILYGVMNPMAHRYINQRAQMLSAKPGCRESKKEIQERLKKQYAIEDNVVVGYGKWLKKAITLDFGESWIWNNTDVVDKFKEVIWNSFFLGLAALLVQIAVAIPLGITAARKQYSKTDYAVTVFSLLGISLPGFFFASVLKYIFAVKLEWFDLFGAVSRNHDQLSALGQISDTAMHYVLPVITISVLGIGSLMRYTRTNMLEVLNADYIRTARAKGLAENVVVNKHAFRNTLIPIVTILGASLPGLFSGAMVTETLFQIPGIGYTGFQAMTQGDMPFSMFYLMFMAVLTLAGTLIADILYAVVDPRVRVN